jgi:hypothetical protein
MSNRIDFFQPEQKSMTIPAYRVSVLIDGVVCPFLEPIEIVQSPWPDFSRAKLTFIPVLAAESKPITSEKTDNYFPMGKSLSILTHYNGFAPASVSVLNFRLFEGQIERSYTSIRASRYGSVSKGL